MSLDHAVELIRHSLVLTLLIATPVLVVGLLVGLIVSLFQAVTQIQEQTLAFIPKVVALVAVIAIFGPWMLGQIETCTTALWASIPQMVGQ